MQTKQTINIRKKNNDDNMLKGHTYFSNCKLSKRRLPPSTMPSINRKISMSEINKRKHKNQKIIASKFFSLKSLLWKYCCVTTKRKFKQVISFQNMCDLFLPRFSNFNLSSWQRLYFYITQYIWRRYLPAVNFRLASKILFVVKSPFLLQHFRYI